LKMKRKSIKQYRAIFNHMECNRCGACCTQFAVCVTPFDIIRISEATGKKPEEFVDLVDDVEGSRERKEPTVSINGENSLLVLKVKKDDVCIFYNGKCSIYEHRPFLCRTYPFKFNGKLISTKSRVCPKKWFPEGEEYIKNCKKYDEYIKKYQKIAKKWKDGSFQDFLEFSKLFL